MKIERATEAYNERRYSKPWIATVDFSADKKGTFSFGDWIGDEGNVGVLSIEANEGQIVATGQKDYRKPKNSDPIWHLVKNGQLKRLENKAEAYKLATAKPTIEEHERQLKMSVVDMMVDNGELPEAQRSTIASYLMEKPKKSEERRKRTELQIAKSLYIIWEDYLPDSEDYDNPAGDIFQGHIEEVVKGLFLRVKDASLSGSDLNDWANLFFALQPSGVSFYVNNVFEIDGEQFSHR